MLAPNPAYFTANDLRNWAMTKTGDYEYMNPCGCALHEFFTEKGESKITIGGTRFYLNDIRYELNEGIGKALRDEPRTYEALSRRLAEIIE